VRLELGERPYESINVGSSAVRNNVEIERGDRGALDDRSHATDEHEAHTMATQRPEDGGEVSRLSRHGEAQSPA
jgi:hypothetical protein